MSSTKFVFFGWIRKTRLQPWPLIGWDIFHFSETAEWNSIKLNRKQDLNVLYQVCVFRADKKKTRWHPGLCLAETFSTSPLKPLNRNRWNLTGMKISTSSTKFVFFGQSKKQDGSPGVWFGEKFSNSPLKLLNEIQRNLTGRKISTSSTKFVFSGRWEKEDGGPALWLAETFSTSPLKPLNLFQLNLTGSKISTSSSLFVFFGSIGKNNMVIPASDWLRHFWLLLWSRWTEFN